MVTKNAVFMRSVAFRKRLEYTFVERSNEVRTDREKLMGQHVDYKL